ncbi:MAG TPA: hypothetical protein VNX23_02865 [Bradyrhizobium sp.]|jgi:hypothetical protein|uniref:hypothetical protein n=1 Tax=Bradyrhizobium sp. TaxID=376 RepID=UPI002B6FDC7F|nr:hypothetical protein [Bradyrhizobium sp.]HXB76347.1 hypothetical protein [Bradyrhizobium sp.]
MTFDNERKRLTVEELSVDCLDIRELHRAGYLDRRYAPRWPVFKWPGIDQIRFDRYLIHIELVNQVTPQNIRVTWTPCNFGGTRPWMHCPHCNRRLARLFKGLAGYFCRDCVGNPPYESQLRNDMARIYLRAYRLRERIGGGRPVIDPIRERPYRMWRKTYDRIRAEIEGLERLLVGSQVVKRAPLWIRPLSY